MDTDQLVQQYHNKLEKVGDVSTALSRLLEAKLYFGLFLRVNKETENVKLAPILIIGNHHFYPDIYTETGISRLRIPPHSYFEIKRSVISDTIFRTSKVAREYKDIYPQAKFYLLYDDKGMLNDDVLREVKKENLFEIYQIDDYLQRIEKIRTINDQVEDLKKSWQEKREFILENAKTSFRENNCSLFLGAGVSMSAGAPSWNELLFKAIKKQNKSFTKRDFKKIFASCGQSPIVMGRYIAPDKHSLQILSNYLQRFVLYKNVNLAGSELIKAICEFVETDKVESVITYNYDDLVETALEQRGIKQAFSVFSKSRNLRNEFPVYHVHGLIPQENSDMIASPILSEKDYHDIYRKSYHWSNIEQLHALDRNSCFFIGLSMSDPNLRRLLDFSHAENDNEIHHYAFLKRKNLYGEDDVEKNKKHFETFEQQLENIGVWVVWYESHDELPGIIRRIIAPLQLVNA